MWNKPWRITEGLMLGAGLVASGLLLQRTAGPVQWDTLAAPVNLIILIGFVALIITSFLLRKRIYLFSWLGHYTAAVSALIWVVALTLVMGLVRQLPSHLPPADPLGLTRMLSFWPFVLVYIWLTVSLGLATLVRIAHFSAHQIPFVLNHLGLFIALVTATLGSADMHRLTMTVQMGKPEWRAVDEMQREYELPLAIELHNFSIKEYPPKLMLVNNTSGHLLPEQRPVHLLVEDSIATQGRLLDWHIRVLKSIDMAAAVYHADTLDYVEWHTPGATSSVQVEALREGSSEVRIGWVSCGSFMFPYQSLKLDSTVSLVMPVREPEAFLSDVTVYTEQGGRYDGKIAVNKPMRVEGWKIYQLSYDETKGRWSDVSVFELVRDPWLPYVYIGIWMMITGAVWMFVTAGRSNRLRKEEGQL